MYNVANEPCAIELFFVNFNSIKFKRKKKRKMWREVKAEAWRAKG